MTITAKVIADTVWPDPNTGTRITTLQLRYPRCIHAEFMTHRVFSRNASSSRAIPVKRLIEDVKNDPFIPLHWGKNQPGMQARQEHNAPVSIFGLAKDWKTEETREGAWLETRDMMVEMAIAYDEAGYHKQIVNRLIEPWAHINVVVTATEWDNFFELRDHEDAEPHIQMLARAIREAMEESHFDICDTHLPYISNDDLRNHPGGMADVIKVSAARCARVSYMTHDNKEPDWEADLALSAKLSAIPPHLSPFEHQARWCGGNQGRDKYANFTDWRSQRYCMERGFQF